MSNKQLAQLEKLRMKADKARNSGDFETYRKLREQIEVLIGKINSHVELEDGSEGAPDHEVSEDA